MVYLGYSFAQKTISYLKHITGSGCNISRLAAVE
jgi:hypothetical protein